MQDQGVGIPANLAHSLGDAFLVHLNATLFPFNHNAWKASNVKHNQGGHAPDPDFVVFFGRKCIGHKLERHSMALSVQYLPELWIGMGKLGTKDN